MSTKIELSLDDIKKIESNKHDKIEVVKMQEDLSYIIKYDDKYYQGDISKDSKDIHTWTRVFKIEVKDLSKNTSEIIYKNKNQKDNENSSEEN